VMGDDNLDLLHAGHHRGTAIDVATGYRVRLHGRPYSGSSGRASQQEPR